jgi:pilus assembly protein FimV
VVKQYTENQYDDDLTVGTDDYDDSYYTGSVDLFEFSNDEDSPISRLKSLILSIDWEITDEVLMQFNEELVDLRGIWAGKKINLVYVQALEKISKYIYQKKADSHPSAIKLLLTLYYNLEKIVSSSELTEEQKKEILLEDVKRFESLKRHISQQSGTVDKPQAAQPKLQKTAEDIGNEKDLLTLKAIVLGIDWEITDEDLNQLRQEVVRLEKKFADSRPRLILLQGIGTLGAYIKLKKSNAHADAFKILHLFYESLEKIVARPMKLEEEKAILFPAVESFNSFKNLLGPAISSEAINRTEKDKDEGDGRPSSSVIAPAFADFPEEEIMGFQAEEEAKSLGFESSGNVDNHVESFFMGSSLQSSGGQIHTDSPGMAIGENREIAIQGVDVELDDEEDFDSGMPTESSTLTPALSAAIDEESAPTVRKEDLAQDEEQTALDVSDDLPAEMFTDSAIESLFIDEEKENAELDFSALDRDTVLQGVDVETEADDDSDEEALPMMGGELAPALAENDEISIYNAEIFENSSDIKIVDDELAGTLGGFFDEEIDSHLSAISKVQDNNLNIGSEQTDIEDESREVGIDEDDFTPLAKEGGFFSEKEHDAPPADDNSEFTIPESEPENENEAIAFVSELEQEESLNSFFDDSDFEQSVEKSLGEDVLDDDSAITLSEEDGQNETFTEIDEHLDSFFDFAEKVEGGEGGIARQVSDDIEEEEVVFELVEEREPLSDQESEFEKTRFSSTLAGEGNDEDTEKLSENSVPHPETDTTSDAYGQLRTCVDSLGIELDDKVIMGLSEEIAHLHRNLTDRPLEKTFLQLLSTITRHIDQNRYDSSADAYVLLQSICSALADLREDDLHHNQGLLLTETAKVLKWQEEILAEQTAKNEAELTIGDPLITDQEDLQGDFDASVQSYEEEPTAIRHDRLSSGKDTKILTDDLRQEISVLRHTLQNEISALRKELKGKYS